MHHSFIHRNIRVDVELRERAGAWDWTSRCDDGPGLVATGQAAHSVSDALRLACLAARNAINQNNKGADHDQD